MKDGGSKLKNYTQKVTINTSYVPNDDCDIHVTVTMENVQDAMKTVNIGDFLTIKHTGNDTLAAYNSRNEACGEIHSPHNKKIISCIQKGSRYRARVMINKDLTIQMVK